MAGVENTSVESKLNANSITARTVISDSECYCPEEEIEDYRWQHAILR